MEPYLALGGQLPANEAAILLMREAGAMDHHMTMIQNLLAWLEYVGLITRRDNHIVGVGGSEDASPTGPPAAPQPLADPAPVETGRESLKPIAQDEVPGPVPVVMFGLDVRLTVDDLAQLTPDQIKAFFEAAGTLAAVKKQG